MVKVDFTKPQLIVSQGERYLIGRVYISQWKDLFLDFEFDNPVFADCPEVDVPADIKAGGGRLRINYKSFPDLLDVLNRLLTATPDRAYTVDFGEEFMNNGFSSSPKSKVAPNEDTSSAVALQIRRTTVDGRSNEAVRLTPISPKGQLFKDFMELDIEILPKLIETLSRIFLRITNAHLGGVEHF